MCCFGPDPDVCVALDQTQMCVCVALDQTQMCLFVVRSSSQGLGNFWRNGLFLYNTFIQSAVQLMLLIHPFTHQQQLAAKQGTNGLIRNI